MYYFFRSLQDAVYAALLEADGKRAGAYSSMSDCAKKADSSLHQLIDGAVPGYFDWFREMRGLRDQMKAGLSVAFRIQGARQVENVFLMLHTIDDDKRQVGSGREISQAEIDECFAQSARLLKWSASHVAETAKITR